MSAEPSIPQAHPNRWQLTARLQLKGYSIRKSPFNKKYNVQAPDGSVYTLENEQEFSAWGCAELRNKFGIAPEISQGIVVEVTNRNIDSTTSQRENNAKQVVSICAFVGAAIVFFLFLGQAARNGAIAGAINGAKAAVIGAAIGGAVGMVINAVARTKQKKNRQQ